jgi:hypothetical protein
LIFAKRDSMNHNNPYAAPQAPLQPERQVVARPPSSPDDIRNAIQVNGVLWAVGNALTTGNFILFLGRDLGAAGLALSLLLALPNLAGVLRLFAPWLTRLWGDSRRAYLGLSLVSYAVLLIGLQVIDRRAKDWDSSALAGLIGVIFVHQLLEYLGQVAQWSWYGALVPAEIRGRVFSRRQALQLAFIIPISWGASYVVDWIADHGGSRSLGYGIVHFVGCVALLLSVLSLWPLPAATAAAPATSSLAECLAPFRDRAYWPFLAFRGWLSFANGISQSAQFLWTKDVLKFSLLTNNIFRTVMQVGQLGASVALGQHFDQFGYRRALIVAQTVVTVGLGCYLLAQPDQFLPWLWIGLGWACWSAYAVHNVALPNLALKFALPEQRAGYIAAYEALGSLLHAAATIGGGVLFDWLTDKTASHALKMPLTQGCIFMLCLGVAARALAIPLATLIREPAAKV